MQQSFIKKQPFTKNFFILFSILSSIFFLFLFQCKPEIKETNNDDDKNKTPTITLSSDSVDELRPVGELVATITTSDGKPHTYSLVSGEKQFTIEGDKLKTALRFDYDEATSYDITIKASDNSGNSFEKTFTIKINDKDEQPPTAISLSANSIDEGLVIATEIATLTTTDPSPKETFIYSLVAGDGGDDNASFTIDGDKLKSDIVFDRETKASYKVRIQTEDSTGNKFSDKFTITINDVTEAITYAYNEGSTFQEASVNNGVIYSEKFITITTTGLIFNKSRGNALTPNTDYTVANVPAGLTMEVTVLTETTAKIIFTGNANSHANANDVNNVTITLKDAVFAGSPDISSVAGRTKNNIAIDFMDAPPVFSYRYEQTEEKVFVEGNADDGTINGNFDLEVRIANGSFSGGNGKVNYIKDTHYTVANLPAGLSLLISKNSGANFLIVSFTGNARNHTAADSVNNFSITFLPGILNNSPDLSSVTSKIQSNIKIIFDSAGYILFDYFNRLVSESGSTPGKIAENPRTGFSQIIDITSSLNNNDYFQEGIHYTISADKPAGINIKIKKISDIAFLMEPSGNIVKHSSADNTEFTINFLSAAFEGNPDINTIINTSHKIRVNYDD